MSDELRKPNSQEQPKDSPTSHQFSEPSAVAAEPGDLEQPSNTPSKSTDATDQRMLEQEQPCSEVDSQVGDLGPQVTAENLNGRERSDMPPAGPGEQTQGISASVTPTEEQPKYHPNSQIDMDSHLNEADQPSPQANAETTNELEQSDTPPAEDY